MGDENPSEAWLEFRKLQDKIKELEKNLGYALEAMNNAVFKQDEYQGKYFELEKKLEIAIEYLDKIVGDENGYGNPELAEEALKQIRGEK
jgi:hypothetical protein